MKNKDKKKSQTITKRLEKDFISSKDKKVSIGLQRLYVPYQTQVMVRSTKEVNRLDAIEVAKEIAVKIIYLTWISVLKI